MVLSLRAIREESTPASYTRGNTILKTDKVWNLEIKENDSFIDMHHMVSAVVEGSSGGSYYVELLIDVDEDEILEYKCDCPAYYSYDGMCKHCVGAALKYRAIMLEQEEPETAFKQQKGAKKGVRRTSSMVTQMIYHYSMKENARYFQPDVTGSIEIEPTLHNTYDGWTVDFRIGGTKKYVLKNVYAFVEALENKEKVTYGKKLAFIHERSAFTQNAQKMIDYMEYYISLHSQMYSAQYYYGYTSASAKRYLDLSMEELIHFWGLMSDRECLLEDYRSKDKVLKIKEGDPPFCIDLREQEGGGFTLLIPAVESFCGQREMYIRKGSMLYHCTKEFQEDMHDFFELAEQGKPASLEVAERDMNAFCSTIYPVLERHIQINKVGEIEQYLPADGNIHIYLDKKGRYITCRMEVHYGDRIHNLLDSLRITDMYRDVAKESKAVFTAGAYFLKQSQEKELYLEEDEEDKVYQLFSTGVEQLNMVGEVYISESLKTISIKKAPKVKIGVSIKSGLLELNISAPEQLPYEELEGLLDSYRKRKKYYRLKNGDFIQLEDNSIETLSELTEGLGISEKNLKNGDITIPKYRAFYLDKVLKENQEDIEITRNSSYKSLIRNIKDVEDSDYEIPEHLRTVLRNYQKTGYRWLRTLESMGFGGILADDMGLGKSIQMLSFLSAMVQEGKSKDTRYTSLLVCPASLVYNWEEEIRKFAPQLEALIITGTAGVRGEKILSYQRYDICITSYDLLKRDMEYYKECSFYCQIIDEAQNIKNHTTIAAKAVKEIQSQIRFALTGTPIENRLSELWSIFDYLMPGILDSYQKFRKNYEMPIVQNQDEILTKRLQRMIKPFILRRLKQDVLKELPDKIENVIYAKLEGEQERLYNANVQNLKNMLSKETPDEFKKRKLQILAEMTRLRQLCCAPQLLYENYTGEAAKLDTCIALIEGAVESGHKVLLFSQFTSMLALIEQRLKAAGIGYYLLTGSTSKELRIKMVNAFNNDETPLFLISLKAGGTGLNLTSATTVIHFDPWWNAAAQNQATDRAHRIGQKDTVTVFKLIAKNTIEEKILKLQEAKKELSDQIISEGGVLASELTKDDFMELLSD